MKEPLPVEISRRAEREIRELEEWWRVNRTAAPNAVREELERVFGVIAVTPLIGKRAAGTRLPGVRRIHVSRIWHFVYYQVHEERQRVEILSLWSDRREHGPPL